MGSSEAIWSRQGDSWCCWTVKSAFFEEKAGRKIGATARALKSDSDFFAYDIMTLAPKVNFGRVRWHNAV